jgi:hypothetical protein
MTSPFPGMDPYLEDPTLWPSFHTNVLDHDWDERAIVERVYKKYGYRDILMQWVTVEEPVYRVGGAFRNPLAS